MEEIQEARKDYFWKLLCYAGFWRQVAEHTDCNHDCSCSKRIKAFDLPSSFEDYQLVSKEYASLKKEWLKIRTTSPQNMAYHKALTAYKQALELHNRGVVLGSLDCTLLQNSIDETRMSIQV